MFELTRARLSARESARRHRLCRAESGYGYTQIDDSHGTAAGGRWIGWYSGPNRGEPWDSDLARRVEAAAGVRRTVARAPRPPVVTRRNPNHV